MTGRSACFSILVVVTHADLFFYGCSSTNEKLDVSNFIEGVRVACVRARHQLLMAVLSDQGARDVLV